MADLEQGLLGLVAGLDENVGVYDTEGRLVYLNASAERMLGLRLSNEHGRTLPELFPEAVGSAFFQGFARVAETGRPEHVVEFYAPWRRWFDSYLSRQGGLVCVVARDVTDQRRAADIARRIDLLRRLTTALSAALTVDGVVSAVLEHADAELGAAAVGILLLEPGGERLTLQAVHGYDPRLVGRQWPRQSVLSPALVRPMWLSGPERVRVCLDEPLAAPARSGSLAAVPLRGTRGVLGMVVLAFPLPRLFDDEERQTLSSIADQCALALERSLAFEQEQSARARTEVASSRLSLLADASGLLARNREVETMLSLLSRFAVERFAEVCIVSLVDEAGHLGHHTVAHRDSGREAELQTLYRALPDDSSHPARAVLESGAPVILDDVSPEQAKRLGLDTAQALLLWRVLPRHLVLVPLESRGRTLGVCLLGRSHVPSFAQEDVGLAEELARRLALAVDNAELLRLREQQLSRMQLLAHAARLFAEATSVGEVTGRLAELLTQGFASGCAVRLMTDGERLETVAQKSLVPELMPSLEAPQVAPPSPDGFVAQAPLRAGNTVLGVVIAARLPAEQPFTDEDRVLMQEVCDRAGLALAAALENEVVRHERERYRCLVQATAQMVWSADAAGQRLSSPSWSAFTGQSSAVAWLEAVHPDDQVVAGASWRAAVAATAPYEAELRLRRHDGEYVSCVERAAPLRDERGRVREWIGLTADVSRQKHIEQALRETNRRKDEFLAMLGHELRNPLAPMRLAVELLRGSEGDLPRIQRCHEIIERQTDNLSRLVDDLLDVSRITRGTIELRKARVGVAALVSRAVDAVRGFFDKAGQTLTVDIQPAPLFVVADAVRLEQILVNLLTNASKYTPRQGHVCIEVKAEAEDLRVSVRDDGVGIPADVLPRIFDLFEQADPGLARAQGGLGIGLTVVRRLAELHGGSVEAHSEGAGRGSEFVVRLPLAGAEETTAPRPRPENGHPARAGLRVLVVDDNVDVTETLSSVLGDLGHDVRVAHEGEGALAAADAWHPNLVILDIGLPGMSGYDVGLEMRRRLGRGVCLAALTGYGQQRDRARSREAGLDHHLVKPLRLEELLEVIESVGREAQPVS